MKFISAFLLVFISITNINCEDCDDEDDVRSYQQNKITLAIHKDSLNVN